MAGPHAHGTVWGWGRGLGQCGTRASAFRSQVALGWQGSWLRSPARILAAKSGVTCRPSSAMTPVTPSVSGTLVSEGCCNAAPRKVTFARAARRVHHVRKWGEGGAEGGVDPWRACCALQGLPVPPITHLPPPLAKGDLGLVLVGPLRTRSPRRLQVRTTTRSIPGAAPRQSCIVRASSRGTNTPMDHARALTHLCRLCLAMLLWGGPRRRAPLEAQIHRHGRALGPRDFGSSLR